MSRRKYMTKMAAVLILAWPSIGMAQETATQPAVPPRTNSPAAINSATTSATTPATQAGHSESAERPALQQRDPRYRLCASDVITLAFPLTPEFDQTQTVQPDGFVSLVGAGEVHLQGLTTRESVETVRAAYGSILNDPIVTIELKDFNKPYFIVGGQVSKPGKYDLRGYTTAAEAVAIAGGFTELAKHSQVLLFRRVNDDWLEVKPLDLKRILQGHDVNEDAAIRPGDMLFVPQNLFSKVKRFIPVTTLGTYYQP
jgi:polysaccharide biosynthesis/export protein